MKILLINWAGGARAWEHDLVARLRARGWMVDIETVAGSGQRLAIDAIFALEARRFGAGPWIRTDPMAPAITDGSPDLVIDLTGRASRPGAPVLALDWSGAADPADGLARCLMSGQQPTLTATLNGAPVATAKPMILDRIWVTKAVADILAGAIGLLEHCIARFTLGQLTAPGFPVAALPPVRGGLWLAYLRGLLPGLASRAVGRLGGRAFDWQVGYRTVPAPFASVADKQTGGAPLSVLPDDGARCYADPFLFASDAGSWLFVEDYTFARGKGVIAVAEFDRDGLVSTPRTVLEEPHHLSYPQVFAADGEIFMIPESGAARELVLYRATDFPGGWVRDTVLLDDIVLADMTLLLRDGRYWLFGTQLTGSYGSVSDAMVVYMAEALRGPYRAHPLNPVLIDRSAARPGGAFVHKDGRTYLPVQDGTEGYGGGLGLAELLVLDETHVEFAPPVPVDVGSAVPRPIHTLNAAGGYEAVDWFVPPSKRRDPA